MTSKQKQIRAVALAALMVLSVFAGTVAFTGSAAADSPSYEGGAVHYENSSEAPVIEVPFDQRINDSSLDAGNFTVLDDGDEVTDVSIESVTQPDDGRVVIELTDTIKSNDLEVEVSSDVEDDNGVALDNSLTFDVTFAAVTLEEGEDLNTYKGSTVAVNATNTSEPVEVTATDEDATYSFEGSTGTNSTVFTFNTENRDLGAYEFVFNNNQSQNATVEVRDLGLGVEVDDLNVTTDDGIQGTVSANAGGRDLSIQVLDSDGDEFANVSNPTLDGQGEYEFDFSGDEFADEDDGEYTVEVTDLDSGVVVESETVNVETAGDGTANFGQSVVEQARGDVVEIPVTVSNTDTASVNIGTEDVGFVSNVTVEDGNNDGEVVILFNTWAVTGVDDGEEVTNGDVFSVDDSDDSIESAHVETGVDTLLDAGDYDLEVRSGANSDADSQNVATLVLEERSTDSLNTWTASQNTDLGDVDEITAAAESNNLTQDTDIAEGDLVITQVTASGLGGIYEADGDSLFFDNDEVSFSINQTTASANRDPFWLNLNSTNTQVVADAENDTYYLVFDSDDSNLNATRSVGGDSVDFSEEDLTANFTVLKDEGNLSDDDETVETDFSFIQGEHSLEDPYNVSNATGQIVEGDSSVAPGTELTIRVRSDSDVRPSFLKTANTYVTENGTFSADFDFSGQNVGDTFTVKVSGSNAASDETFDGTVVEGAAANETETVTDDGTATVTDEPTETTETATTEASETTEATATEETATEEPTETTTPGFGVVVALVALVAAALLATRRD